MIAPVIVLFYLVFGSMVVIAVSARSGPVAAGLALGLVLCARARRLPFRFRVRDGGEP